MFSEGQDRGARLVARSGRLATPYGNARFAEESYRSVFANLSFNRNGEVAFGAQQESAQDAPLELSGLYGNYSVWASKEGSLRPVARLHDLAPGLSEGDVFFPARAQADLSQRRPFDDIHIDSRGRVSFVGNVNTLDGPANGFRSEEGIWQEDDELGLQFVFGPTPHPLGRPSIHSHPALMTFDEVFFGDSGVITYTEKKASDYVSGYAAEPESLFRYQSGSGEKLLAYDGGVAPWSSEESRYINALSCHSRRCFNFARSHFQHRSDRGVFRQLTVETSAGRSAFVALVEQSTIPSSEFIDPTYAVGVWKQRNDESIALVAKEGSRAPGVDGGDTYGPGFNSLVVNASSQVAFIGWLAREPDPFYEGHPTGLWSEGSGRGLELVVREGDAAIGPDLPVGTTFGRLDNYYYYRSGRRDSFHEDLNPVAINAVGQVAFAVPLSYESVSSPGCCTSDSVWVHDPTDGLTLIVRGGQQINVSDDPEVSDLRTVAQLRRRSSNGGIGSYEFQLNDRGEIAFWAQFTDGTSGIFVSRLVAIPEPGTVCLLFCGLLTVPQSRR